MIIDLFNMIIETPTFFKKNILFLFMFVFKNTNIHVKSDSHTYNV